METVIPHKLYYKIGEVAGAADLKPSVLRYWETEFLFLNPQKSRTGQRLYTKKDLDLVLEIKRLLYSEKLTIAGAKRRIESKIKSNDEDNKPASDEGVRNLLIDVRKRLEQIRETLV